MDFLEGFQNHVEKINGELHRSMDSPLPLIREMGEHSLLGEGKRLRPLLFVLTSQLCGYQGEDVYHLSIIFEYVHVASLIHDDVLDDADIRRKKPSVKNKWGNLAAVLGGDFYYSRGAAIAIERPEILKALNDATLKMIEGQLLELMHTHDWDLGRERYMDIIVAKTAALMSAACACGGIVAGVDGEWTGQLAKYGLKLGIAFQIMDDILDYTSSEETFGKPVGKDLKEGKITLPLIYALGDCAPAERVRLQELFKKQSPENKDFEKLIKRVRESGAIERVKAEAKDFADQAAACLEDFPDSRAKDDLKALNTYLVERDY